MFEIRPRLSVYNHAFKLESAERQRLKILKQTCCKQESKQGVPLAPCISYLWNNTKKQLPLCLAILPT